MNIKLIIVTITFTITSCSSNLRRNDLNNLIHKKKEKFDVKKFQSKNIKINEIYTEIKNDTVVEIADLNDVYIKNTHAINSPFINKKTYYKGNYQLKAEVNYFHMFPIGISKKYSTDGQVIETKNWDEKYPFSVDQLVNKMKNDFNIDITNSANVGLDRYYAINDYHYKIIILPKSPISIPRQIVISATTGNLISDGNIVFKK